jgi:AraC family transcriptional regulator, alkane utilization regulator
MDALSEVLRAIGLKGAIVLEADLGAPWGVAMGTASSLAKGFLAEPETPMVFHVVLQGSALLAAGDETPVPLRHGDAVLLPSGAAHRLLDAAPTPAVPLASLVKAPLAGHLVPGIHQGSGTRTRIVTGVASVDRGLEDPLLASLPALVRADLRGSGTLSQLDDALGFALSESDAPRPGGHASLARLAELVVIEILRRRVESSLPGATGWLAALNDRHVGRALALLHARPGENWTVEKLARQVGLSRSALAEHFTALVGEPPFAYLTAWRLTLAAQALATTPKTIQAIAKEAGYESAGAFSHAFKRAFGRPPTRWRLRERRYRSARDRKGKETS